ncbi:penicillin-binding protein 2 [Gracilinema caldarium]|uniref:Penicillin-binding protein 2 n=1 Tax=Gracilinema caldarium (strain ATCC 51460 / DSM 7334 / H1) TaxID=744872 RepID=F8F3F6_GRAC1|nr:penicillin-binding protein 2 [Gracilinema caldarium]AEJ19532.1 penicillin-binding protein 2 [Gracilinema caldarium DSM 7334]
MSLKFPTGEERPAERIVFLQILYIIIFILYAIKLFSMQIISGNLYRSKAANITQRVSIIPAQRGEIFDRNINQPIVLNIDSFAVQITPAEIPKESMPTVFQNVADIIGISKKTIDTKIPPQYYKMYQPVDIAINVPFQSIAKLAERKNELPGVSWRSNPIRNYVDTGSLAHIIGYVGDITKDELKLLYNKGYQAGDIIGKAGIEKQYDELLRGKNGREIKIVDVRGKKVSGLDNTIKESPEMGKNLVLTIDRSMQTLAEKALGERMGAVVILKPSTGEILAMVSYPWYDPNLFNKNDASVAYQQLLEDPKKPLLNRAIQSSYPPASTFKIIMSTAILNEKAYPPEKTIECKGEISYGNRVWKCWIHKPGHGYLNLQQALAQSCDIYFWVTGRDYLGVERIVNYAKDFGYGELTDVDIPGEIPGFVPTPQWKDRRFHEKWLAGDTMNMSIGQGYTLVTPLQMANMVAMVVNNGTIYQPHLLKEIRDPVSGAIIKTIRPTVLHQSDIDKEIFQTVRNNMRSVITEGTARFPMNIKSVQVAGKTGTGEVGLSDRWHSWFAAYAPYNSDNPDEQIVVSVIVEASNTWEWWAPYASAIIFQGIFAQQTYEDAVKTLGLQYLMSPRERRE